MTADVLKEGLANYVQDKYTVVKGVELGSTEELPKKKRRKALSSWKRRATQEWVAIWAIERHCLPP